MSRAALEARWLALTREILPELAAERGWPIRYDHCFQRVLLDNSFEGVWYAFVAGRPAYRTMPEEALRRAVTLAETVVDGRSDLIQLNRCSLALRRVEAGKRQGANKSYALQA